MGVNLHDEVVAVDVVGIEKLLFLDAFLDVPVFEEYVFEVLILNAADCAVSVALYCEVRLRLEGSSR